MQNSTYKVLAISGSTRQQSSNLNLIRAIAALTADTFELELLEGLDAIPHFNPDLDHEEPPQAVAALRGKLNSADGILICTPEYAAGVPGTLKNAIDWTVSSMGFSKKPVALITASTSGYAAHQSLLGTLLIIESRITEDMQLLIPGARTKVSENAVITDEETLSKVTRLIHSLAESMKGASQDYLPAPELR